MDAHERRIISSIGWPVTKSACRSARSRPSSRSVPWTVVESEPEQL